MGGGTNDRWIYRSTIFRGKPLGSGIAKDAKLIDISVEHPREFNSEVIVFGARVIRKAFIHSMEWIGDSESGPFEVRSIRTVLP